MGFSECLDTILNGVAFFVQVKSVITGKQVEDTQLGDEASRFWMEIVDRLYVFDRQEKEVGNASALEVEWLKTLCPMCLCAKSDIISQS